ncbi:VOC family protein [Nocardioides sp.]|uniref:VOC family protein n=1 Tax=Nocardioides sp. TaxID=35761 RepID=UPI00356A511F
MAILNPYLTFEGNTRDAMEFYQRVFGGELDISPFGDLGITEFEGKPVPADGVMHAHLTTPGGFTLMAADNAGMSADQTPNGHISLSGDEADLLRGYFNALAEGGRIDVPLEKAPWGDEFGQVKDKFGINWMVNIAGAPPA